MKDRRSSYFSSGDRILRTGVYRVEHADHALPLEVSLPAGETFPGCEACDRTVSFAFLRELRRDEPTSWRLYKLPVLDISEDKGA